MILVDAGPLIALVDADDRHHLACTRSFAEVRETLGTVWPVLTEALFQVGDVRGGPAAIWKLIERGAVRLLTLDEDDIPRIRELMEKYADLPMDLADAALVRVAERDGVRTVLTVDRRDFNVYRLKGGRRLAILP
jgi:predicted nucleic acid-binding protein